MEENELLLSFIKSLCLADHIGDVGNDIDTVLRLKLEMDIEWEDLNDLYNKLDKRNIKTLFGN